MARPEGGWRAVRRQPRCRHDEGGEPSSRRKRRRLPGDTASRLENHIAPDHLQREFGALEPNQKWVADFTYIWTAEGWLYAAAVMDLYARGIVGWSMSDTMQARMVSCKMAVHNGEFLVCFSAEAKHPCRMNLHVVWRRPPQAHPCRSSVFCRGGAAARIRPRRSGTLSQPQPQVINN
jgi:hypothetical protein